MTGESQPEARAAGGSAALSPAGRLAAAIVALGDVMARMAAALAIGCLAALLIVVLVQTVMGMLAPYFPAAASRMSVSWEYAGYLMGIAFMFGMGYTLRQGGHIRVNLVFDALAKPLQRAADLVVTCVALSMVALLAKALATMAIRSFNSGSLSTASLTPLWIPQGAFALGACLFAFLLLVRAVALLAGLAPEEERDFVGAPPE